MDVRELGYFVAVFEERSVSAAARRSHVSQPSVSEAVIALEGELGQRLFVRHRRGALPTPAGEKLYPIARRLVSEVRSIGEHLRPEAKKAKLKIGVMQTLGATRVAAVASTLMKSPDIELSFVDEAERSDLRIVSRSLRVEGEVFVPLFRERYVVIVPRRHRLAGLEIVRGADLAGERLVARCHCENAARLAGNARPPEVVAVAASEECAVAMVAAGVGVAIVPEGVVSRDDAVVLRPLADRRAFREVGVVFGKGSAPPAVEPLVRALVASFNVRKTSARASRRTR
jgi:DNA-binding transcriptional LysR family regulator